MMNSINGTQQSIEVREKSLLLAVLPLVLSTPLAVIFWLRGQLPIGASVTLVSTIAVTLVLSILLSTMQLVVRDGRVRVRFGGVLTVRNVALADVVGLQRMSPPRWAGLGIRILKEGMLYTLTWGDAVEFKMRDGSKFYVGLSNPDEFCNQMRPLIDQKVFASS